MDRDVETSPRWQPRSVSVGDWRITALSDGTLRLDGGSMWGVVPRALWKRMTPPAADNTIPLALRPFLAERGDVKAVIEVGIGDRWEEKWRSLYGIDRSDTLVSTLAALGLATTDVTHVIASHCHFDHVGAQVVERDGELVPLFENARHFAPRIEVQVAKNPDHVRRASYRPDDVVPIETAGLLETYEGDAELVPGIRAHDASGHSDGVSVITIDEDEEETAIFWADVVPTTHHIQPPYIMAFDIDVPRSFESRSRWLARAAEEGWLGLFYHDLEHAFGRVSREGRRYAFEPVAGAPRSIVGEAR
jgi:glyoxylase-like metal-dependent hydrolase (beta-lactamase superfamily II)